MTNHKRVENEMWLPCGRAPFVKKSLFLLRINLFTDNGITPDKCIFNQVNAGNQPMRNGALFFG